MSDESIINLSDSTKATMRNYAMVAGFMTIFIFSAIAAAGWFTGSMTQSSSMYYPIIATALIIFGSILAFLHKRDLVSITFLMIGLVMLLSVTKNFLFNNPTSGFLSIYAIIAIILGIAILFSRNEQKYICAIILIIPNVLNLIGSIALNAGSIDSSAMMTICAVRDTIRAFVSLYAVLCIGLENPKFPGYRLLTADEDDETKDGSPVHFKVSGSVLGYMLLMIPILAGIFYNLGIFNINVADIHACDCSCGLLLIFVGFLMLVAGRMKFTPFMFMILGILFALQPTIQAHWLFTIFFIIVGILCIFRSDRRILIGAAIILHGLCMLFINDGSLSNETIILIISFISFAIYAYVCFALCSDNRLKLI